MPHPPADLMPPAETAETAETAEPTEPHAHDILHQRKVGMNRALSGLGPLGRSL